MSYSVKQSSGKLLNKEEKHICLSSTYNDIFEKVTGDI